MVAVDFFDGVDDRKMPPLRHSSTTSSTHMTIYDAFEAAQNEDGRVLSNSTSSSPTNYCFIMPKGWMDQLVSYIEGKKRRGPAADLEADDDDNDDTPGKINNSSLVETYELKAGSSVRSWANVASAISSEVETAAGDDAVAVANDDGDEDDTDSKRSGRRQKWQRCEERHNAAVEKENGVAANYTLRSDVVHGVDYVLVGENLWTMLSSKYGSDIVLRRRCQHRPDGLMVEITPSPTTSAPDTPPRSGVLVSVPSSGKWTYELSAGRSGAESSTDEEAQGSEVSRYPDDSETNSIVSHSHGIEVTRTASSAMLLLPPSTTSTGRQLSLVTLEENNDPAADDPSSDMNGVRGSPVANGDTTPTSNKRKRYSSGLGNLGNTCFMNSTLQCLAHTGPLRQYFVNDEYKNDLNRENPLGTGGELASEFAALLSQMWGKSSSGGPHSSSRIGNGYYSGSIYDYGSASSSVIYPRNFKYTLGKHAEQFMGYDQHDSQELATYLLDALHEDTNRVTKKPYVEKPEQEKGETDDVAAEKAWSLHLKREDSRVLESFMGQVKSRVQCPNETCGRVSTTFDPFMYLSVPIPGAAERTIPIVFVPLDPMHRPQKLNIRVSKTATIAVLQKKIANAVNDDEDGEADDKVEKDETRVHSEDICVADVFQHRVYAFLEPNNDVDRIRETDTIYAYETRSVSATRAEEEKDASAENEEDALDNDHTNGSRSDRSPRIETLSRVTSAGGWEMALGKYTTQFLVTKLLNPGRSSHQDRMDFLKKMDNFIDRCRECVDSGVKEDADNEPEITSERGNGKEETGKTLADLSEISTHFRNVDTSEELAIFEFCSRKFREETFNLVKAKKEKVKGGVIVQVLFRRLSRRPYSTVSYGSSSIDVLGPPLVLRIPGTMTVHGLRREIAQRIAHALMVGRKAGSKAEKQAPADTTMENGDADEMQDKDNGEDHAESDDESEDEEDDEQRQRVNILQQLPLYYCRESRYQSKSQRKLGSLSTPDDYVGQGRPRTFAKSTDEEEQDKVAELVGNHGEVLVHFPTRIELEHLDSEELKQEMNPPRPAETDEETKAKTTTVMDCIAKYCQMEQLEESEMWYCNRCKDHVRAWKQFHLYRTPPILIVHLKRFQYSATTHRRQKIETFIDFPLTGLDLRGDVMHWEQGEEPVYDCYAVSNHFGGLGGGHYTAYAKNDEGVWCYFDDSRVTTDVNEKDIVSSAAYVLYYRRRSLANPNGMGWEVTEDPSAVTARVVEDDDMDVDDDDTGAATDSSTQEDHGADEDELLLPADGSRQAAAQVEEDDDEVRSDPNVPNPQAE